MNFINVLLLTAGFQAVLLWLFFFFKKENQMANRLLALLMWVCAINCLVFGYLPLKQTSYYAYLVRFSFVMSTTFFPSIYLYTNLLLGKLHRLSKKDLKHYLPYLLFVGFALSSYSIQTLYRLDIISWNTPVWTTDILTYTNSVLYWVLIIQGFFYSIKTFLLHKEIEENIDVSDQYTQHIHTWLQHLLLISVPIVILFVVKLLTIYGITFGIFTSYTTYRMIPIVFLIYMVTYQCITSPVIFKQEEFRMIEEETYSTVLPEIMDVQKTVLYDPEKEYSDSEKAKLKGLIEDEKIYLNTKLSLQDLVKELDISKNRLSALLQVTYDKKFYEVINHFRLDEAIKQLDQKENDHLKLEVIAYQAGFHSKATFNKLFKEKIGLTPSVYRKNVRLSRIKR